MASPLHVAAMSLTKRAEGTDPGALLSTFVDMGGLLSQLSTTNHQVIYGRRGTGKTHVLLYLAEDARRRGEVAVYIDLRTLGSAGLYSDPDAPAPERVTRLLHDVLGQIHDELVDAILQHEWDSDVDFAAICALADELAALVSDVRIVGAVEVERKRGIRRLDHSEQSAQLALDLTKASVGASRSRTTEDQVDDEVRQLERGALVARIHLGTVAFCPWAMTKKLPDKRIWVVLDEWSNIPLDLQPLLADTIKRCLLPVPGLCVKIAAIEQRSRFRLRRNQLRGQAVVSARRGVQGCPARASRMACMGGTALSLMVIR